jgi:GT2 family glycosyltransferase
LPLRVVDASARPGAAAARNVGVTYARADAFAFCDADDEVASKWLPGLVTALRSADLVAGAIVHVGPGSGADSVPREPPRLLGWLPYAQTANCAVRRTTWESLDGFDERLVAGEDVDFTWRAQLAGVRFAYERGAVVRKYERDSTLAQLRQHYRYGKGDVDLYARYRQHGARVQSPASTLRSYGGVMIRTFGLASPAIRSRWAAQAGRRAGRLVRSAQRRVWAP